MQVCTCFLLFGIFAYTHSSASKTPKSDQRSVNLALETVLEFNNKDKEVDLTFLDNIQNFITKVKTVIDKNSKGNNLRRNLKTQSGNTFTGFIKTVIHILNTYEVNAFVDFFNILDEEIRNYHYRGCRFYELTENYEIRKLIAAKLDSMKGKPTSIMKIHINALSDMLQNENYDSNVKDFLDYINSLYKREAEEDFHKVITDLEAYGSSKFNSSNNNLRKIIKSGVRSIIFDHYTNLKANVRRDVKEKIEIFWQQLLKSPPSRGNIPITRTYYKYKNYAKNPKSIKDVKESEPNSRKDLIHVASKKAKNLEDMRHERNDIKQFEHEKAEMKRDDTKTVKKRYKLSGKDTDDQPLDTQEKNTRLSSQHTDPVDQQKTKNEHQEHLTIDILSGETFSSIEFYEEPQLNTQYTAIIPNKLSQKPPMNVSKKSEEIEALNVMTRVPKNNTGRKIFIEESTGILPKAVLDKLAVQPSRHESRHSMTKDSLIKHGPRHKKTYERDQKQWHGKIYKPKYVKRYEKSYDKTRMTKKHWSKSDTKYESRQRQKSNQGKNVKTSEPNNPFILVHNRDYFRQNYVRTTDSVFNMEVYQYNGSSKPLRVKLKQNKRRATASTKAQKFLEVLDALMPSKSGKTITSPRDKRITSPRKKLNAIRRTIRTQQASPTNSYMERLSVSVPSRAYSQRNKMIPWKSPDHSSSFNEGMTLEHFDTKEGKRRHGKNAKRTSSSLEKDPFVIERIKNLERQLNDIKSRMNVNISVVKTKQFKHRFVVTDNILKREQSKTKFRSNVNLITNDFKEKRDKPKMSGMADNKTEHIIKYKNVQRENSTNKEIENVLEKSKNPEIRLRSYINMTTNYSKASTDKTDVTQKAINKADVKNTIVNNDHHTMEVTRQPAILKEDKKTETSRINIVEITPIAKDRGIKVVINDHDADNASNETLLENRTTASSSTPTKATESTTKTTTTVRLIVPVSSPSTLKLSTISLVTSPKLRDVLQNSEFNATVDENKNQLTNSTSQVVYVSRTTLTATNRINK